MSWYFIQPSDVWFFRDARPFGIGEAHHTTSLYPPAPTTVAGALRSAVLGRSNVSWQAYVDNTPEAAEVQAVIGSKDRLSNTFALRGPFLAYRENGRVMLYSPMPADVYQASIDREGIHWFRAYRPAKQAPFSTKWGDVALHPLWPPKGEPQDEVEGDWWLSDISLEFYLKDQEAFTAQRQEDFLHGEPRLGIGMDYKVKRPKEDMLYTASYIRLDDRSGQVGLLIWANDELGLPEQGWLQLGGEARAARYEKIDDDPLAKFQRLPQPATGVKLLLLTPAYFDGGWKPKDNNWDALLGVTGAQLKAVALGKPLFLGGWDLARKGHKGMHAYVPAGSVYYFEIAQGIAHIHKPFTQTPKGALAHDRLGFGQAVLGVWDWQTME